MRPARADGTILPGLTNHAGHERTLLLTPSDLTFIRIDHQIRLQFGPTEVVIESAFVLQLTGSHYELDPGDRATLGPILALYPDTLQAAIVDDAATLLLRFISGASVSVKQDPRLEAWQVNPPGNYLVVCMPGRTGDLAIWT